MTEDDTFDALRKWTFEQIKSAYERNDRPFNVLLRQAGWGNNEFWDEVGKRLREGTLSPRSVLDMPHD